MLQRLYSRFQTSLQLPLQPFLQLQLDCLTNLKKLTWDPHHHLTCTMLQTVFISCCPEQQCFTLTMTIISDLRLNECCLDLD